MRFEGSALAAFSARAFGFKINLKIMKRFLYLMGLIIICSCTNPNNNYPRLVINAKLLRSFDTVSSRDTLKHQGYNVQLSIANKSDKPITIWTMTCSWDENFIINNDYMTILPWDCDSNFPKEFHIKPHDSLINKLTVIDIGGTRYSNISTTRFGFIFIDSTVCQNTEDFVSIIGDKSKQQIIWSNELWFNRQ
jgi:hypothetical protein